VGQKDWRIAVSIRDREVTVSGMILSSSCFPTIPPLPRTLVHPLELTVVFRVSNPGYTNHLQDLIVPYKTPIYNCEHYAGGSSYPWGRQDPFGITFCLFNTSFIKSCIAGCPRLTLVILATSESEIGRIMV
jgi:hypothetical protein